MAADFKVISTAPVTSRQRDFTVCVAPLCGDIAHAQTIGFTELWVIKVWDKNIEQLRGWWGGGGYIGKFRVATYLHERSI